MLVPTPQGLDLEDTPLIEDDDEDGDDTRELLQELRAFAAHSSGTSLTGSLYKWRNTHLRLL